MLILPSQPKLLLPIPQWQWREPSLAQPKDEFGSQNRTRFVIRGWQADGGLVDEQWFEDRKRILNTCRPQMPQFDNVEIKNGNPTTTSSQDVLYIL